MHPTLVKKHLAFHKKWDHLLNKLDSLPQNSLEEYDALLGKLKRLYYNSSIRLLCTYLQIPDAYTPKIEEIERILDSRVRFRFDKMHADMESFLQFMGNDKDAFNTALEKLKLLAAFQKRWTNIQKHHVIIDLQKRLRKHHHEMFTTIQKQEEVSKYQNKLLALSHLKKELDRFYDWYANSYLRLRAGKEMLPVDFLEADPKTAPLEHCIKVPDDKEIAKMEGVFNEFVRLCKTHDLMGNINLTELKNYDRFLEYCEKYSISSEKSDERLKAATLEHLNTFHTIISDANMRSVHKAMIEKDYLHSFATYFAPVDEILKILKRGHIDSADSLSAKIGGTKGIPLNLNPHIHDGDIGFVFPLTKVISKHNFFQVDSDTASEIHVFSKEKPSAGVRIDIRDGVFLAPKDKIFRYNIDGREFHITGREYFTQFFEAISSDPPEWFDPSRIDGWLSRHCIFYDDYLRETLLSLLEDRSFTNVMTRFTNKAVDNLAFYHIDGSLKLTNQRAPLKFSDPQTGEKQVIGLTLFSWQPKK